MVTLPTQDRETRQPALLPLLLRVEIAELDDGVFVTAPVAIGTANRRQTITPQYTIL